MAESGGVHSFDERGVLFMPFFNGSVPFLRGVIVELAGYFRLPFHEGMAGAEQVIKLD
jgi:hypothetical protein